MNLLHRQLANFFFFSRPLKSAVFDSLISEEKAILIPIEQLKPIASITTKKKNSILVNIQRIVLLDNSCESVNPFAKVGLTRNEKDFFYFGKIEKHLIPTPSESPRGYSCLHHCRSGLQNHPFDGYAGQFLRCCSSSNHEPFSIDREAE